MNWIPFLTLFINLLIIWFMPKRMNRKEIYLLWMILSAMSLTVDIFIGHTGEITLLHFEEPGMKIKDLILETMLAPSFGVIFCNFMPDDLVSFIKYVAVWVVFATWYEWLTVQIGFLVYQGWKLWFSTVIYALTFIFIKWQIRFIRKNE